MAAEALVEQEFNIFECHAAAAGEQKAGDQLN